MICQTEKNQPTSVTHHPFQSVNRIVYITKARGNSSPQRSCTGCVRHRPSRAYSSSFRNTLPANKKSSKYVHSRYSYVSNLRSAFDRSKKARLAVSFVRHLFTRQPDPGPTITVSLYQAFGPCICVIPSILFFSTHLNNTPKEAKQNKARRAATKPDIKTRHYSHSVCL